MFQFSKNKIIVAALTCVIVAGPAGVSQAKVNMSQSDLQGKKEALIKEIRKEISQARDELNTIRAKTGEKSVPQVRLQGVETQIAALENKISEVNHVGAANWTVMREETLEQIKMLEHAVRDAKDNTDKAPNADLASESQSTRP